MGRLRTRTKELLRDDVNKLKDLFGTASNAHRALGLSGRVSYANFYLGMSNRMIKEDDYNAVMEHWQRWREVFLRPEVPEHHNLWLTPQELVDTPEWWPQRARKRSA